MSFLSDALSFVASPVTTLANITGIKPKILNNPIVAPTANAIGGSLMFHSPIISGIQQANAAAAAIDEVSGRRQARDNMSTTIKQQDEAFREAVAILTKPAEPVPNNNPILANPENPVQVQANKPEGTAPVQEQKEVARAKKRIIRPVKQGRASTILTSPLGLPGNDTGDGEKSGKRLLGV